MTTRRLSEAASSSRRNIKSGERRKKKGELARRADRQANLELHLGPSEETKPEDESFPGLLALDTAISLVTPSPSLRQRTNGCTTSTRSVRHELVNCSVTLLVLFSILGLTPGCGLLRAPSDMVSAVVPGKEAPRQDLVDQQIQLQRFTDDFLARSGQALDESAERLGTDTGRAQVLRLKLISGSSLLSVVSGPNPGANLLDLVSVTVLTRKSVQDYWMKTTNGAAFQPWFDASRVLETNVWNLAARFLQPTQVVELRLGIDQWYSRTPEVRTAFFARPHEFASMVRTTKEKGAGMNSVFSWVNLDPTAGLDPAVREVTRTRLFAERAMFTMQRMPFLLRLQTELLAYELTAHPGQRSEYARCFPQPKHPREFNG